LVVLFDDKQRACITARPVTGAKEVEIKQYMWVITPKIAHLVCRHIPDHVSSIEIHCRLAVRADVHRGGVCADSRKIYLVIGSLKRIICGLMLKKVAQAKLKATWSEDPLQHGFH
jgi:hypothetical protein